MTPSSAGLFLLALALPSVEGQSSSDPRGQKSAPAASSSLRPSPVAPLPASELSAAIERGRNYLCRSQNRDGSWGSPRWTGGVDRDPVPGAFLSFGAATTALCLEALLDAGDSTEIKNARARAEGFLIENLPKLRGPTRVIYPTSGAMLMGSRFSPSLPGANQPARLDATGSSN